MTADEALAVLPEEFRFSVDVETIDPFAEGAWFAWRLTYRYEKGIDIRNGLWWRDDGKRVLSLAVGSGLHAWGGVCWETWAFVGGDPDDTDDVCCHRTLTAAQRCAITFLISGRYCSSDYDG